MAKEKKTPERMCLACRQMRDKRLLIRVVRTPEGNFLIDKTGKLNGRGAYLCDNAECVSKCLKSRLLNRNFKCEISDEVYYRLSKEILSDRQN